jgi:hypothetical protein
MSVHSHGWKYLAACAMFTVSAAAIAADPPAKSKAAEKKPTNPKVLVTISKETTYITEPLRSNGYPDYVAALNQRLSEGVTPENNAAVLLWKAMGPKMLDDKNREPFFRMLGIPPLPEEGDYLAANDKYYERAAAEYQKNQDKTKEPSTQFFEIMKRPWSKKEFPIWAEWVEGNQKHLATIVEATKRPKCYEPLIGDMVIAVLLTGTQQSREAARILATDAMYQLSQGKTDKAWEDLLACHRLARLIGQGSTLIDTLVAILINQMAETGDRALLEHGKLSSAQIAKMRADLANLPPMPKMADNINLGERFLFLDCVATLAREGASKMSQIMGSDSHDKNGNSLESFLDALAKETIDWDIILRMGNSWYDRLHEACAKPTRAEQEKALRAYETDLKEMAKEAKDLKSLALSMLGGPTKAISERVGQVLISLLMPALSAAMNAENRSTMQGELNDLAFALALYKADNGAYPAKLDELTPKYIGRIPKDICAKEADLHYRQEGNGFVLYGVGQNGKDDGGKSFDDTSADGTRYDDLVVRVPSEVKP